MANILKQEKLKVVNLQYKDGLVPISVEFRRGLIAKLTLSNDKKVDSACVQCKDLSCIKVKGGRVVLEELVNSQTEKVCPSDAIYLGGQGLIYVEESLCIGCGLCVVSCPIGAIYLNENNVANINHESNSLEPALQAIALVEVESNNPVIEEHEELFRNILKAIRLLPSRTVVMNRLVCKSLQLAGVDTYLTRQGDVNLRMDGIGLLEDKLVLIEVELVANLDSPRDILDDYAVFCSRYKVKRSLVSGLIVLTEFPNTRTEFWELITDIEKIVDVKIATVSLAALLTIVWSRSQLQLDGFYLGKGNTSARQGVSRIIGRDVNLPDANDLIEAAK